MKRLLFIAVLMIFSFKSQAQSDTVPTNKCYEYNTEVINYSYDRDNQIHNYSGNWDFDGDGYKDSLFFIGTRGAHLYYYLKLVLSSENKSRNYSFILLDFPCLGDIDQLKESAFYPPPLLPKFVVFDFDSDLKEEIYLHIDLNISSIPEKLKKEGLTSSYILAEYENGELKIKNFLD